MKEIPAFFFEKLQDEERISALMLLEKAKKAEEMWLDALENLLPVKAKIRYLVEYIDKTRGYKSLNLLDRIQKKIKYAFNINNTKDKVTKAETEYKRLKEESKKMYEDESNARDSLGLAEFTFASVVYQGDTDMANFFVSQCEEERKKHTEEIITKYINKLKETKQ